MSFTNCFDTNEIILMEGALGERMKREYGLSFDDNVALAGLVYSEKGRNALKELWTQYADIAYRYGFPFIATTPTRRANRARADISEFPQTIIKDNTAFLREVQKEFVCESYIGGLMGSYGDAYTGKGALSEDEAYSFHKWQADQFKDSDIDFLYAGIMPTLPEAAGMARAMESTGLPYIISFTIKSDGRLIDNTSITDAIIAVDSKTLINPVCYMTNCVHPDIVIQALSQPFNENVTVRQRFLGIQENTSDLSFEELDNSREFRCSEPEAFACETEKLNTLHKLKIFGGCCGTDNRHMECIARKLFSFQK